MMKYGKRWKADGTGGGSNLILEVDRKQNMRSRIHAVVSVTLIVLFDYLPAEPDLL